MSRALDALAVIVCLGAGAYLLLSQTADSSSYLQVLGHGIGGYFVAKGLWMARSLQLASRQLSATETLVEWAAFEHQERQGP